MEENVSPNAVGVGRRRSVLAGHAGYVFWIMFAISFLNYLDRYVLTGAANTVARELGFDLGGIGYISSAFLIVYTLATLPLGIWADRVKRKNTVAISVSIWSVVTTITALAGNFTTLFLSRMLLGIGEAGYFPAGTALMSDYFRREVRSRIMSWWSTAQLFGILGGYGIGGVVAGLGPGQWRWAFVFTGIPGLLLAYLVWRVREPRRNQADEDARESISPANALEAEEGSPSALSGNIGSQIWSLLRIKSLIVLIVVQVFAFFVLGVNTVFLPTYLQQGDTFGFSPGLAGLYSGGVIVLAGIGGTTLGGYIADLLNKRHRGARILVCGIGFLLSAPAFALAVLSRDLTVFTIFFVLTALLLTVYTGPSTAATQDVVPSSLRASAVAVSLLIAHLLGDAAAPSIVGVLANYLDPTHGGHFSQGIAGQDLSMALLITCVPALILAGLVGIFGARWMERDVAAAEQVDGLL